MILFASLVAYASCCIELPNEIEAAFKDAADTCLTERSDVAGPIILGAILRSFDRSDCPSDEDVEEVMKAFPEATCMAKKAGWMTADGKLQLETIEADVFDFLQNTDEGFLDTLAEAVTAVANKCGVQLPDDPEAWAEGGCPEMPADADLLCIYDAVVDDCFQ